MVELQLWAEESARALTFVNPSESVRRVLMITHLESVLRVITNQLEVAEPPFEELRSTAQNETPAKPS